MVLPVATARDCRVASLHLHPPEPGAPMEAVQSIQVVSGKGIEGEPRYYRKRTRRHISLIEREQIGEHAASLGLETIPAGAVRANIETLGVHLVSLLGREIHIGEAILLVYSARTPCHQMDAICTGLRELMENQRQGVLAQVLKSGRIRVNDPIWLAKAVFPI